jgi:hypothetical protein
MTFYPEVMPLSQQKMLHWLGTIARDRGFYLAGGTALGIQVGHRRSVDLDWFSGSAIDPMALAADLKGAGVPLDVTDLEEGTLHGKAEGVKLSFFEYRYPDLVPLVEWPEYDVRLAGLEDLASMKLSAVGGRGSRKVRRCEQDDTPEMLWPIEWGEVKRAIEFWVRDFARRQAPP